MESQFGNIEKVAAGNYDYITINATYKIKKSDIFKSKWMSDIEQLKNRTYKTKGEVEILINKILENPDFKLPITKTTTKNGNSRKTGKGSGENQGHGKIYERMVIERGDFSTDGTNHTSKWDGFSKNEEKTPMSAKIAKLSSEISFADFNRQRTNNENFELYVGFWDNGDKYTILEEYKVLIDHKIWQRYIGNQKVIDTMYGELDDISNDVSDDNKWDMFMEKYKNIYGKDSIIKLRFKRDHVKQKRMQCAISYNNFINIVLKDNKYEKLK